VKHIVGFSGGIDSQEAAARVIALYGHDDTILMNSQAGGNEDPLTVEFIADYSATVHPVVIVEAIVSDIWITEGFAEDHKGLDGNAVLTFRDMIRIKKRPPSRKVQFCTSILKLAPQRRWMQREFGVGGKYEGEDYARYTGVRRDESHARKDYPDREWDDYFDCWVNHIIAGLAKVECFAGARERGEKINPLYLMGFGRVGCAPCVNSGKEDILNWVLRRPDMIDKIRDWETETGYTYFPPMVPGLKANNTIDQVVAWSKTARGGRKELFPIFHERESCESKYGLCE
jgi:3'-phosphoadenosine 5'-phosphosulfate sulfotransferase (PAPS reductase)/FAD synthetase